MAGARSDTIPKITSTAVVRILNMQIETRFKSSTRKGDVRNNPRGGTNTNFKSNIRDDFGVTKARLLNGVRY